MSKDKLNPDAEAALRKLVFHLWEFENTADNLQWGSPDDFSYPLWDEEKDCENTAKPTPNQKVGGLYSEIVSLTDEVLKVLGVESIEEAARL
jgi:hypothetical protein